MWLSGKRQPNHASMVAIADALDVSVQWLDTGLHPEEQDRLPRLTLDELNQFLAEEDANWQQAHQDSGIRLSESDGDSYLITITNDAMLNPLGTGPVHIPVGSTVQIDRDRSPQAGQILLIRHQDELKLRLWQPLDSNLHWLTVANPNYQNTLSIQYQGDIADICQGVAVACRFALV